MSEPNYQGADVIQLPFKRRLTSADPKASWTDAFSKYLHEPIHGGGGGSGGGEMLEPRVARLEADVGHIQRDLTEARAELRTVGKDVADVKAAVSGLTERIAYLASNETVSSVKADIATLKERTTHLATASDLSEAKRFFLHLVLGSLGFILALVTFAPKIQQWVGTAPLPVAAGASVSSPPTTSPSPRAR